MNHALPLAGIDHPDALYRAAGGEIQTTPTGVCVSRRGPACPCCSRRMSRIMRVRVTNSDASQSRWIAMCAMCAASMLATNPRTIVGGCIRPRLRRAG